ncbi:hypothetical protein ES319_A07G124900v1 [Gossypium barbadense]|uniref:Protein kinase domain-containing protein n=1 Tax=Gossypium barbadense TaxID=3634 RepID=A0A5J5V2H5_GOSBA|nr:hypothetical protein ES319_A07G124900v1 [Gossypium barbadense]
MSDDMLLHFSSNSSNQSDHSLPTKIAKLEARLVGKASSASAAQQPQQQQQQQQQQPPWSSLSSASKFVSAEDLPEASSSSDSDDENGGEFLILANTQKRQKVQGDDNLLVLKHAEAISEGRQKIVEAVDVKASSDGNRRKQGRGRGHSVSNRGLTASNSQLDNSYHKDNRLKEQFQTYDRTSLEEEVASLHSKVAALEEDLQKCRQEASDYQNHCRLLEKELKDIKDYDQKMKPKRQKMISDLLIAVSKAERREARMKVQQDSLRLGNVGVIRAGTLISETWEDGQALKDLNAHLRQLLEAKEAVEWQRKQLKKRQSDKGRLIREMKRIRDEDGSRFNNFQILNNRYALLNLLGKGGFSEVYKAYDLVGHRYVACKLHGLNAQWSEDKKQSYIRHAIREYNIHKTLVHRHIVRLWDIFEIDHNTFCTVLEYCSGKDLDAVLKATLVLLEKEARIIIVQIFQGLVYLNKRAQKIIHYDLKPGNVLFDELGVAKVTDFGLSKIVEDDVGSQGMELTSQGAGTYWYLPPECFELSKIPLISSKVDVWSAGVLFYQMLFGRRPFGHDQTQERILREDTIIKARKVEFPSRPSVSNEAKDLIRRCLTYNQAERPDVLTIAQDPYLTYSKK